MKKLQWTLTALGIILQVIIVASEWPEFAPILRGDIAPPDVLNALLFLLPSILSIGGVVASQQLHRRGSRWAWVMIIPPIIILSLILLFAIILWINPIVHQP